MNCNSIFLSVSIASLLASLTFVMADETVPTKNPVPVFNKGREAVPIAKSASDDAQIALHLHVFEVDREVLASNGVSLRDMVGLEKDDTVKSVSADRANTLIPLLKNESKNGLKLLSRPTLVTVFGRPAAFSEGQDLPVVKPMSLGTAIVDHKQLGTRVDMVPNRVSDSPNIRLDLTLEQTAVDIERGIDIKGVRVPGLRVRSFQAAVEMPLGGTAVVLTEGSDLLLFVRPEIVFELAQEPSVFEVPIAAYSKAAKSGNVVRIPSSGDVDFRMLTGVSTVMEFAGDFEKVKEVEYGNAIGAFTRPARGDIELISRRQIRVMPTQPGDFAFIVQPVKGVPQRINVHVATDAKGMVEALPERPIFGTPFFKSFYASAAPQRNARNGAVELTSAVAEIPAVDQGEENELATVLKRLLPQDKIVVVPLASSVVLQGVADSHGTRIAVQVAEDYYPKVISMLTQRDSVGVVADMPSGPFSVGVVRDAGVGDANRVDSASAIDSEIRAMSADVKSLRTDVKRVIELLEQR